MFPCASATAAPAVGINLARDNAENRACTMFSGTHFLPCAVVLSLPSSEISRLVGYSSKRIDRSGHEDKLAD